MKVTVNGTQRDWSGPPDARLLWYVRNELGLTGTKPGCGEGECGACTVLVDGIPSFACRTDVGEVAGRSVVTIEGLASPEGLHPVQQALIDEEASQCGYCTPGMALRAAALLALTPEPSDAEIREAMAASVCRCNCYPRLMRAVRRAVGGAYGPASGDLDLGLATASFAPRRPWDLTKPSDREWFDLLGEGLVVVWPPRSPGGGSWAVNGGAWLHVAASGKVTAFSGKVDVGQDNTTAFRLLVAEELAVEPDDVSMVLGDTDLCPFDIGTFGSRSMPDAGQALRRAAAGARSTLIDLAAEYWGEEPAELRTQAGMVVGNRSGKVGYGDLVEGRRRLEVLEDEPALLPASEWRLVGHGGHTPSRADVVTGRRRYVSDLERPELLYGAVVRPPVPGARLRSVETGTDELAPGVTMVHEAGFCGVVAGDLISARRAAAGIEATWDEPAPGPADVAEHLRSHPVAGMGWQGGMDEVEGDPETALAQSQNTFEATYTTAYLAHVPLETRAALAEWHDGRLTVWVGTQVPFGVRSELAEALGIDEETIRVIVPPTGSGYGGKHRGGVAIEAARLARAVGAPVKVHWSRAEEFEWGYLRPMAVIDVRAALDGDTISAWELVDINGGAAGITFPYACHDRRLAYQPADSPLAQGSYRALGAPANHFARESHIDDLAHAAGVDPLDFRIRNLEDDRLARVVSEAAGRFGWAAGPDGTGVGLAAGLEKGGRVATCAEVRVDSEGRVEVTRLLTVYECGALVNPDTVRNQVEGGTLMALGGALFEQVELDDGHIAHPALASYRVPRFTDVPEVDVVLVDRPDLPSAGAGETPLIAVAPAIGNAIFAATGKRLRSLPLIPSGTIT